MNIETTLEDLNELIEFAKGHEWDLPITAAEDLEWARKCIKELQSEAGRWEKQYIQTNAEMNRLFNALITTRERLNRVLKVLSNIDWGDEGNAEATVKEITMQLATKYDTEGQE